MSANDDTINELLDTFGCGVIKLLELVNEELHFGSDWLPVEDVIADDIKLLLFVCGEQESFVKRRFSVDVPLIDISLSLPTTFWGWNYKGISERLIRLPRN